MNGHKNEGLGKAYSVRQAPRQPGARWAIVRGFVSVEVAGARLGEKVAAFHNPAELNGRLARRKA